MHGNAKIKIHYLYINLNLKKNKMTSGVWLKYKFKIKQY